MWTADVARGNGSAMELTWPVVVQDAVIHLCWTFIVWRVGAGLFEAWKDR